MQIYGSDDKTQEVIVVVERGYIHIVIEKHTKIYAEEQSAELIFMSAARCNQTKGETLTRHYLSSTLPVSWALPTAACTFPLTFFRGPSPTSLCTAVAA